MLCLMVPLLLATSQNREAGGGGEDGGNFSVTSTQKIVHCDALAFFVVL